MKKIVSLILVLAIAFSLMAGIGVNVNATTQVETILNRAAYLAANNPHAYDGLCLAFCADCYKAAGYAGVSMGTAYNAGTQWIQSTSSSNIPVGALVFFDLTWHATAGHVGIYAGNGKMYDAESQYGGIKLRNFTTKGYRGWGWYNRIAPTGSSSVDITTPTISFDKGSYIVGETAKITWTASSSQSDFKHYWLVITNTTTGEQLYGTVTGNNGDVSKNYYNLNLTKAGIYKVGVYTIRNDGTGLSDIKTFGVGAVDVAKPIISFNKTSYIVGETAKITWTASSSQSDFKYYWLVINNTTTGEQLYGTVTGNNGDVTKNYYNLNLTKAGTYRVAVYTIRNDGSGVSDIKNFSVGAVDVAKPIISFNKTSYSVGETAKITWTASSSQSDFKHYWLVISNTTTGEQLYGTVTGNNGDVSKNYYNLNLTKAGTYRVAVYTIRNDGSGVSDIKTFTVTQICSHSYSSTVTKSATCTATGVKTFTCSKCGDQYTQSIAALGHNYSGSVTKAATCTEKGVKTFKCSRCTSSYTQDIAALGHNLKTKVYDKAKVTQTGSSSGDTEDYCTRCNYQSIHYTTIGYVDEIVLAKTTYTYSGNTITPSIKVVDRDGKTLKNGTDYTVKYASGRKNVGKYAVKVSFQGKYTGSRMLYFKIVPKGTTLSKLTAGKKSFTAKWKKLGGITGYQILYSTNTKFTSAKLVTIRSANTLSKTIKSLSAKKNYYVRVRTYKTVSGTHYMSAWSKTYKVKTK